MKNFFDILNDSELFSGIEADDLSSLLSCLGAEVKTYNKKDTVITAGDPAKNICILLSGKIQLERLDCFGNRNIITTITPPGVFLEAFACADIEHIPLNAVATDYSEIMFINCNRVLNSCTNCCEFHNKIIHNLLKSVAKKNITLTQKAEISEKRTTREKLLSFLEHQSVKNNSRMFTIPYNRQELSDYLNVDRSGLSTEIGKLKKEGIIDTQKNSFKLLKN